MAITLGNSATYQSGSSGYLATHTISSFDASGTDGILLAWVFNRDPLGQVSGCTADGNAMTLEYTKFNIDADSNPNTNNTAGVQLYSYVINNGNIDVVASTPSYKLCSMIVEYWEGVDTTDPVGTITTHGTGEYAGNAGYVDTAYHSVTGTSGNLFTTALAAQNDDTLTEYTLTEAQEVTHADGNIGVSATGYIACSGSSQTFGWTLSSSDNWVLLTAELNAASGGEPPAVVDNAIFFASNF